MEFLMTSSGKLMMAAAALLFGAQSAYAEQIQGEGLKQLVSDKRVYLATPFGGEFPLLYKSDGSVSGDGTALGLGRIMAPKETGSWWVEGSNLCQEFPTWYDGATSCFTIERTGETTINWHRDDGESGTARIEG
jgi:hypothetical protein